MASELSTLNVHGWFTPDLFSDLADEFYLDEPFRLESETDSFHVREDFIAAARFAADELLLESLQARTLVRANPND